MMNKSTVPCTLENKANVENALQLYSAVNLAKGNKEIMILLNPAVLLHVSMGVVQIQQAHLHCGVSHDVGCAIYRFFSVCCHWVSDLCHVLFCYFFCGTSSTLYLQVGSCTCLHSFCGCKL